MKGGARKRLLGWFLSSTLIKKIAPRLIESIKERRIIAEFRTGRVGAAAAATNSSDAGAFLRHLGTGRKVTKAMRVRISHALEAYGPIYNAASRSSGKRRRMLPRPMRSGKACTMRGAGFPTPASGRPHSSTFCCAGRVLYRR